jgi:hypothetical protein
MRARTLALLALVTFAAALFAWALQREPGPGAPGQPLLPQLASQLNDVTAIVLEPAGGDAFRLERTEDSWRTPEKHGYRVDPGQVRRLLVRLADARIVETKTANPALHDRLGVEDLDGRPGSGVRLGLEGPAAAVPLLIGQRETRGLRGTYVRRGDEATALLVDQDLQPEREALDWLERDVLDIPPEEIEALEIVRPDGETLDIDRDELGIFRIARLPEGYRPSGPTAADAMGRVLSGLRLDDVRPLEGWAPEDPPSIATFRLRDGLVIEARSWESLRPESGATFWTAFSARHAPAGDDAPAADAVSERAAELNERLGAWLYRLPAWKHEQLTRRRADLLLPLED